MKRALSILLVIATLLVCAPAVPLLHAHAEEAWDGTPATAFASGSGTIMDPYMIETVGQLVYLAISVNQGNAYEGQYIALANDIEFSAAHFEEGGSLYNDGRGWTPIGLDREHPFKGHFNGNGHYVRNLVISLDSADSTIYAGLFGYCEGTIKFVRMESCRIEVAADPGEVSTLSIYAGAIVAQIDNGGMITGCINDSPVTVHVCDWLDDISWLFVYAGGIAGYIYGRDKDLTPSYASNSGAVTVNLDLVRTYRANINAGGIVGFNSTYLTDSINSGAVTIQSSRKCSFADSQFYSVGGIAGGSGSCAETNSGKIYNCTNQGTVTLDVVEENIDGSGNQENYLYTNAGGIAGCANDIAVLGCRNDADVVSNVNVSSTSTAFHPYVQATAGGIVGEYIASTIDYAINSAKVSAEVVFDSASTRNDCAAVWVGGIAGGIASGSITGTINQALNYGKVNAIVNKGYMTSAGGIAGVSAGIVSECANRGVVNAETTGPLVQAGGISGDASGTIDQCANLGAVSAHNWNTDFEGTGNILAYAGGIAGYHTYRSSTALAIENCYNTNSVTLYAHYLTAQAGACAGGIMGNKLTGDTVNYCYNIGNIYAEPTPNSSTGYAFAGGIVGMYGDEGAANYYLDNFSVSHGYGNYQGNQCTDAQMQLQETFVGFDFLDVWTMQSDLSYPYPELYALESMFSSEAVELELVSLPAKTTYTAGECIDYSGLKVQGTYLNGEKVDLTSYTCSISKDTPLAAGTHTVEVRFNGARVTFPITVTSKAIDYIDITDLDVPVRSAMPDTEVTADPLFHSVSSVDWSTDGPFVFGKEYAVTLTLRPTESAIYSADTKVRINGTVIPSRYDAGTNTITATCQFPSVTGVFFHIIDAETGAPISNATVTLGKHVVTTGATGKAFFEVSLGSVTDLSVTAELYPDYVVDNYVIGEDPNVYIMLSEIKDGIQTAFCNGTDVLLNSTQINTYASHLQAQIQVSGRSARKITRYEIVQKNFLKRSVVIASSTNGVFTIPNTSFKKNADVYVRMYTVGSDGEHDYECKLKIKTLSFHMENSLDFDDLFPVSMDYGFTFPSGTPLLDGHEMKLPSVFGKDYRTVIQIGNDKILIGAGQIQDLLDKDQTQKDKDDIFKEMLDEWKKQETYDKESKVTGMLALVIEFDENSVTRAYGHFYVKYQLEIETGTTIVIPVIHVPIRVDIEVGLGGRVIMTNVGYDFENMEWLVPKYQVGFEGSLEARLGIGCKVASAGIYGSAELDVLFDVTPQWELASLELSGELGLHATYDGLILNKSLKYPLVSEEFSWPVNTYALRRTIYTPESYGPLDRSYLAERSQWLGQITKLSEGSTVSALQTSAYEGIAPKMAVCGDTVMMVFADDDGSEGLNYQHLYYSLYDRASHTWSEPAKVDDNGLTDLQFEVISDGSHIHIIYTEAGLITEENKDDLPGLAAAVEVATAVYDPAADCFTDYTVLTDNDSFETMPQLAATDDGLVAVWATNLANDVFGQNANNLIHRSVYSGGSWSAPEACGPMGATIASLDAGRLDGEVYIAAIRDTDCDLATIHDRIISLTAPDGTVTQVQTGTGENDNATFLNIDGTDLLVWYADSNLHTIDAPDAAPEALFSQAVSTLSPDFQFITLGTGSAILYTCTTVTTDDDGNRVTGSDVFGLFHRDGQWGEPVAVTQTQADRYVDAFAVFADGEDLVVPYRSTAATFTNGEMELACDFMTTNVRFAHNIGIDALSFPPSQLFQGDALDVTVRVANRSWKDVDTVTVAVTDDKGNVVFTQAVACHIGSGSTENIAFTLDKDLLQQGIGYTVSLSPTGYADADPADNTASLALWYSDLTVQAKQLLLPDGSYLQYTVSNLGNLPSSGELQVYCMDGNSQTQLTSVPLETLEPGTSISGLLPVQESYYAAGSVFLSVLPDTEELYDFNDTVTVSVRELTFSGSQIVDESDTATVGPELDQAHLDYDLYTGGELTVTAEENGFTFSGIEGLDAACYTYADSTLTLHESYLQSLAAGPHYLTLQYAFGEHTEEVLLTVEVTDSTPVPVTVTAQQAGTVYYDGHPVEPGVDFSYSTPSEGNVSYSYSADGASWQAGLPTAAGTYTVLITVAPDEEHHFAGTQCTFALTIEKAARAISSPLALAIRDGRQTFGNAVPTAGSTQGQVLYGYSTTNDASTVTSWSAEGILPAEANYKTYYIFAKVTEGDDYQEAVSLGLPLETLYETEDFAIAEKLMDLPGSAEQCGVDGCAENHPMQAFDIIDGVVFVTYDGGYVRTYDLQTGEFLSDFLMGCSISHEHHCGNAMFGNVKYDPEDRFPVLYSSGDLSTKACYVERIITDELGVPIASQLVQWINFDLGDAAGANGAQAIVDAENGRILYQQRKNNSINDQNNMFVIGEFPLPLPNEGELHHNGYRIVSYSPEDLLKPVYTLPYFSPMYQGAEYYLNQILQTHGPTPNLFGSVNGVMVFDALDENHPFTRYINLSEVIGQYEPQGIAVYNGKLYISYFAPNACIYEIEIDLLIDPGKECITTCTKDNSGIDKQVEVFISNQLYAAGKGYTVTDVCITDRTEDGFTAEVIIQTPYTYQTITISGVSKGHNMVSETVKPTCTERGYTTHTCTECGDSYVDSYVPALGHDYSGTTCTVCGVEKIFLSLRYDDHYDVSGKTVEIIDAGAQGTAVVTIVGEYLVATGIGNAQVKIDGTDYEVTVDKAKVNLVMIVGQSNAGNHFANSTSAVTCPVGTAYYWGYGATEPEDYTQPSMGFHAPLLAELYAQSMAAGDPVKNVLLWEEGYTSKNGKSITAWAVEENGVINTSGTDGAAEMIRDCLAYYEQHSDKYEVVNKVVFCNHGTTDHAMEPQRYIRLFTAMWERLKDAGMEYLAFLRVRGAHSLYTPENADVYYNAASSAQFEMVRTREDMFMATTLAEAWTGPASTTHSIDIRSYITVMETYGQTEEYSDSYGNKASYADGMLTTTMKELYGSNNKIHYGLFGYGLIGADAAYNMYAALNGTRAASVTQTDSSGMKSAERVSAMGSTQTLNIEDLAYNLSFYPTCGSPKGTMRITVMAEGVDITEKVVSSETSTFGTISTETLRSYVKPVITVSYTYGGKTEEVIYTLVFDHSCNSGHAYESVVTAPTCTEQGYTTHTCTACGDSYVDSYVPAADHRYDDNCDAYCNDCDHGRVVEHDYLPDWLLDETYHWRECKLCQHKAMYVKHDYDNNCDTDCNTCGHTRTTFHYYTNGISSNDNQHWRTCLYCHERILVEDHRYDNACDTVCDDCNYVRTVTHEYSSTWTSDGTNHWHECVICHRKQELLSHSYDNLCDTSCNDCGYVRTVSHYYLVVWSADEAQHWHECHVCGDRADVTEHSWKAATCYEPKTCTVCGTSVGAAKGHNWKAATCTAPKTCTNCGETEGAENWHSWKDGTCTEPMVCTVCGEIGSTAPGHNWTDATCWVPKTCAACGLTEGKPLTHQWTTATCTEFSKCALCGLFGSDALNHDWQDETCTQPMICKRCGETAGRPLGHNMLPADCTMPSTCGRCGHQVGSPKPHNWSAPTCTGPQYCCNCGVTTGSPLPHSWAAATCWVPKTCTECGLQEGDPKAHSWKPATCTEPETCTNCGTTRENPTGHLWQPLTCYKPNTCLNCGLTEGRPKGHDWTAATCTKPQTCVDCGLTTGKPAPHIYSDGLDGTCDVCGIHRETTEKRNVMHMFRMYDPNSGEHFYTGSEVERANLVAAGWNYEGVGFTFSQTTGLPVYRLYDPVYGEHLYTMDEAEKAALMAAGWNLEGIAFNSAYDTEVPQYRLHNPNEKRGAYHFTASVEERDFLISLGWEYQGIGFYSSWK